MGSKFKQNDLVHNPETSEIKKVFIALEETFVAMDGSVNLVKEFEVIKDTAEGDSDGIID